MVRKTFTTHPSNLLKKTEELIADGWKIILAVDTSSESTGPDSHGAIYGGAEVSIVAEMQYEKPKIIANGDLPMNKPCNPPRPAGR